MKQKKSRFHPHHGGMVVLILLLILTLGGSPNGAASALPAAGASPEEVLLAGLKNPKMDSGLAALSAATSRESALALAEARGLRLFGDQVQMQIATTLEDLDAAAQAVTEAGGTVTAISQIRPILQGWAPVDSLRSLAGHGAVNYLYAPEQAILLEETDVTATTEALVAMGVPAWHAEGYTGAGVKIAVIDGGFTDYDLLLGSDLPDSVVIKNFVDGEDDSAVNGTTKHGTGCAEIVHDIAPDADLFLIKVGTNLDLEEAVNWLETNHDVDIISTSLGWYNLSPGDGTGFFADLVQQARDDGTFWATAAGNDRQAHWGGSFSDPNSNDWHNFNGSQEVNFFGPGDGSQAQIPAGVLIRVYLRWDDWTNVDQDYDLFLMRWDSGSGDWVEVAFSINVQSGLPGQWPTESIFYITTGSTTSYGIKIQKSNATRAANFELFAPKVDSLDEMLHARSLANLADAPAAMTVAALDVTSPFPQEPYSSEGPANGPGGTASGGFIKPDISAYANVSTESYGTGVFNGTSAATPHVAGAAALVLSSSVANSPDSLESFLTTQAVDMGDPGMDSVFGYGRLYLVHPSFSFLYLPTIIR